LPNVYLTLPTLKIYRPWSLPCVYFQRRHAHQANISVYVTSHWAIK
jgi:hypothetical protein